MERGNLKRFQTFPHSGSCGGSFGLDCSRCSVQRLNASFYVSEDLPRKTPPQRFSRLETIEKHGTTESFVPNGPAILPFELEDCKGNDRMKSPIVQKPELFSDISSLWNQSKPAFKVLSMHCDRPDDSLLLSTDNVATFVSGSTRSSQRYFWLVNGKRCPQ